MSDTSDALAVARLQVARERPYYNSVLWALQPVPVKDFAKKAAGPMGVDRWLRLYYDPEKIGSFKVEKIAAVLVHEIGHVLRSHVHRQGGRNAIDVTPGGGSVSIWNIAGDLEINDDLATEHLPLGDDACYPKNFKDEHGKTFPDGLMAEEYYEMLINDMKTHPAVNCGSGAHGQPEDHEQPPEGNDRVPNGVGEAEQELMRMKVAQDVEAYQKQRGNVPGWLERWAKDRLKSKVDWRRMLAALVRNAVSEAKGMSDYTYQRPGRRSGALPDFVWPAMRQPTPRIHVQIDTSGSMSAPELSQALAEVEGVLTAVGMREGVTVSSVDAAVHTAQKVFRAQDVKLMGGGGTDMALGLREAEQMKPRPHVIILITDCETGWPDKPLRMPLIVARTSTGSPAPRWAKVVDVVPEKSEAK